MFSFLVWAHIALFLLLIFCSSLVLRSPPSSPTAKLSGFKKRSVKENNRKGKTGARKLSAIHIALSKGHEKLRNAKRSHSHAYRPRVQCRLLSAPGGQLRAGGGRRKGREPQPPGGRRAEPLLLCRPRGGGGARRALSMVLSSGGSAPGPVPSSGSAALRVT